MFPLQTFPFTWFSNFVIKTETVVIDTELSEPVAAIINEEPGSNALSGNDFILGYLKARVETSPEEAISGILNQDVIDGARGRDTIIGSTKVSLDDETFVAANGITRALSIAARTPTPSGAR